jgi:hypothetical protein
MGRWCNLNGFEYKFWFGCQESGFDFLDGVATVWESPTYFVELDTLESDETDNDDKNDFIEWYESNGERSDWSQDELDDDSSFNTAWIGKYVFESSTYEFRITDIGDEFLEYLQSQPFDLPDFDAYEKTIAGTGAMYDNLLTKVDKDTSDAANFCLACIVYHLSTYSDDVSGTYDV